MDKPSFTRRHFLRAAVGAAALTPVLAACQPQTVEVTKIVEKPVEVTKVVEKEKVVEKSVEVTKVVQQQVVITATAQPKPAPKGPVKLTFVFQNPDTKSIIESMKSFFDQNPNISVDVIGVPWTEHDTKVDLLLASGEPPAIWGTWGYRCGNYYMVKDLFTPLDDLVKASNVNMADFLPPAMVQCSYKGKLYALAGSQLSTFWVYNKDLMTKAGIKMPTTWDDQSWTWDKFTEAAKAVTKTDPDIKNRIWGSLGANGHYDTLVFGSDLFEEADYQTQAATKSKIASPAVVEILQMWQDFIWKYKVQPPRDEAATFGQAVPSGYFPAGRAGMMFTSTGAVGGYLKPIKGFQWDVAPSPVNKFDNTKRAVLYANPWSMFTKQKNPDEAWLLLKWVVSPDLFRATMALERAGKGGGLTSGGIPSLMSMEDEWATHMSALGQLPLQTVKDVMVKSQYNSHVFSAAATPKWAQLAQEVIEPNYDQILLNKVTVAQATKTMDQKINEVLASP